MEENETPSPEIDIAADNEPADFAPTIATLQQTNLYNYFTEEVLDTDTAAPINGESSDGSASDSGMNSASDSSSDDDTSGFNRSSTEDHDSH